MKAKIFITTLCLLLTFFVNAQRRDSSESRMNDHELGMMYLQKSKNQKTAAWVLLGVGLTGWIGGAVAYTNAANDFTSENSGSGALVVGYIGLGCTIASIPIFVGAAKNKGRAEVLLHDEKIFMGYQQQQFHSVGVAIALGK